MKKLLNYRNKKLHEFPIPILNFKSSLTNLNLEDNLIEEIPEWIGELSNLKVLYLSNNKLNNIERLSSLNKLEVLHLSGNNVKIIPNSISNLVNLKRLYLTNNSIEKIGEEIKGLVKLKHLLLANNKINTIGENLGKLANLELLNLFNNEINELPDSIGNLENLYYLQLSKNNLSRLPNLKTLKNLTSLEIFSNMLNSIPSEFNELVEMKNINIGNNKITKIENIPKNVVRLSIYVNPIERLDDKILNKFTKDFKGDFGEYLYLDNEQLKILNLNELTLGEGVKILDLKNKIIKFFDFKDMPWELQDELGIKREIRDIGREIRNKKRKGNSR